MVGDVGGSSGSSGSSGRSGSVMDGRVVEWQGRGLGGMRAGME